MPEARPVALVTGSARGIGRGILLALAERGYDVGVHYRNSRAEAESVVRSAEAFGVRALSFQADLTDPEAAARLVLDARERLGGLAVLVNNVGNYLNKPLVELEPAEWRDMLDSNLSATFYTCRTAIPLLRGARGGRIVNLGYAGSGNLVARPAVAVYAIAKTGVTLLTKAIAKAEMRHGITANVVAPGVIENSVSQPTTDIPAGRLGEIREVADAVLYLVSPEAAYVTGQTIEVAGGWNL